ncbi:MAG: lysylphosphatidylglycerol synthase transmembrane domain-containing protein [candidate division WOR-3 bacterium]
MVSFGLLGLLLFLFRRDLPACWEYIRQADSVQVGLAAIWYVVFILVSAWRWQVLLRARDLRFSTGYLSRVFVLGLFFCKLLPTSIGGDVMRIAYTARPGRTAEAFSATFLDRLIGFVSLTFLAVASALALFAGRGLWRERLVIRETPSGPLALRGDLMFGLLLSVLALLVLLTLALLSDRLHRFFSCTVGRIRILSLGRLFDSAFAAVKAFRHHLGALALSFLSGLGVQAALSFSWFHAARAIGGTVPLVYYLILIPLLNIVVNIPSIGGLGVREVSYVALFTQPWLAGALAPDRALAAALLFLALDLVFALAGGLLFAFMRRPQAEGAQNTEEKSAANTKTDA